MRKIIFIVLMIAAMVSRARADEPNVQAATAWWPDLTNVVTPVAWRDHPHRFCVVYDGTLIGLPVTQDEERHDWEKGQPMNGMQISFSPSADAKIPPQKDQPEWLALPDGKRVGEQGWLDGHAAPVLWTRWHADSGVTLRQFLFSHMTGGGEARSGTEPMFAWLRLEVAKAPQSPPAGTSTGFLVKISAPHIHFTMNESDNCRLMPKLSQYPKPLGLEKRDGVGNVLLQGDGGADVRLALKTSGDARSPRFLPRGPGQRDDFIHLPLPVTAGAHVDILVPMVPAPPAAIKNELALGFDGALAQADAFWSPRPATAAAIHTPEPLINAALDNSVRLARMMTTTVTPTGEKSLLSGALHYSFLWGTPTSMTKHMLLDPMGWHDDVAKYLEIYRQDQGRTTAPGPAFKPHPGYFGPPKVLESGDQWLTDHGSVLYTASRHALLSGDQQFIDRWLEPILKGCDFIKDARRLPRDPPAVEGVMPPGSASDVSKPIQALWSDGWNYKGLVTAARLLRVLDHPRAGEFEREAAEYREAIVKAFRAKAARQPKWTDPSGKQRVITPMTLTADDTDGYGHEHPFYLDTGPTFGVYAGVISADDPLMRDAADFLREGPHGRGDDPKRTWSSPPRLIHEMSSAEPCYSWNIFHSHQLGDRERFLEGMYSIFCGALARTTHVSCETRGGVTENVFSSTLAVELARLAVIDDELEPENLHLMRLAPLAWISKDQQTRFENMPTEFGPVTLKWQLTDDGRTLRVEYAPKFRRAPRQVLLHVPPVSGLVKVIVNGREQSVPAAGPIKL